MYFMNNFAVINKNENRYKSSNKKSDYFRDPAPF